MEVRNEANDILSFRRAHCWRADGGRSEHHSALPTTVAEKIADALMAAPNFITDDATPICIGATAQGPHVANPVFLLSWWNDTRSVDDVPVTNLVFFKRGRSVLQAAFIAAHSGSAPNEAQALLRASSS
jgi:hypothetical protein